jgi:hypothetical protein
MFTNRFFNLFGGPGPHKFTERELVSLAMLAVSLGALTIALTGGVWLVVYNNSLPSWGQAIVIGTAYLVGWLAALTGIRVYGNLILPSIINMYAWGYLLAVCGLYMLIIMNRLYYVETFDKHYWDYLMIVTGAIGAMVGLHFVIEDHDLRLFSIPLLSLNLLHLGLIVYCYVFDFQDVKYYLWEDLLLFFLVTAFSVLTTANLNILIPVRNQIASYFDRTARLMGLMSDKR